MRREWEESHAVIEELVEGPPSRRANATLTPCPNGNHLWCIGGEFFSEDGNAHFYNDVFRYTPEKDEWRKFVSPTCPGPRSAHAVVGSPIGGGKLFLFGGEFSSLRQNNFHHYRDFWCFDIATHSWDRIDTKERPSARSGHRMAMWKHYVVLFGGFNDPGYITKYMNDLWVFDIQEYKWREIVFRDDLKPPPRSGFSFLPTPDGVVLHGGYCKEYVKGKRPVGVMLDDTWFLKLTLETPPESAGPSTKKSASTFNPLSAKWERRKRSTTAFAPSLRSGCTMALWAAKNMGVLFGGVTDEDTNEETLESVFHNDLYGYQLASGKWIPMLLKKPKKKGAGSAPKRQRKKKGASEDEKGGKGGGDGGSDSDSQMVTSSRPPPRKTPSSVQASANPDADPEDPSLSTPPPRYNAMLAVLRNTLHIYGGIYERGSREYTLDDFYTLQLDKLDRYVCLKESAVLIPPEGEEVSSSGDDDEDDESGDDDTSSSRESEGEGGSVVATTSKTKRKEKEVIKAAIEEDEKREFEKREESPEPPAEVTDATKKEEEEMELENALKPQVEAFMGVAKDAARSPEEMLSTPLPGETLAAFYARSRDHWNAKVYETSGDRGKQARRVGFTMAQERYNEYKPTLKNLERILAEAGLDEEEMKRGAAAAGAGGGGGSGHGRNRR
ncbi:galactose oxidase [Stereum hirsutum FP-91666 SS1]|uniref:galactose oxidase n=1 Tax=Stereum hirsutum (strain FP-91666) TaxID=721885 RepID=UPI000440B05B|nr:galactose oxidase [Stereum hirsutum FP-91666 SS1]EIM88870.1 galactose oxidase [Stereum hirsutum FP-91666 SS1]